MDITGADCFKVGPSLADSRDFQSRIVSDGFDDEFDVARSLTVATGQDCATQIVECISIEYKQVSCAVTPSDGCKVQGGDIWRQDSQSPCDPNESYWIYPDRIVVTNGCRARFRIYFEEGYGMETCECKGDPHCYTFDRYRWHYQGDCEYMMVRDNCGDLYETSGGPSPTFNVLSQFWNRDGASDTVTWVKSVTIELFNPAHTIVIDQGPSLFVNDEPAWPPYPVTGTLPYSIYRIGDYMVRGCIAYLSSPSAQRL
ncbi:hypothetical protein ScPMuIL_012318 [Solemya velum]